MKRLEERNPYTMAVICDTDPDGVNIVGRNPALTGETDYREIELMAMTEMPQVRE